MLPKHFLAIMHNKNHKIVRPCAKFLAKFCLRKLFTLYAYTVIQSSIRHIILIYIEKQLHRKKMAMMCYKNSLKIIVNITVIYRQAVHFFYLEVIIE